MKIKLNPKNKKSLVVASSVLVFILGCGGNTQLYSKACFDETAPAFDAACPVGCNSKQFDLGKLQKLCMSQVYQNTNYCCIVKIREYECYALGGFDQPCATFGLDKRVTSAKAYKNALCLALYNEEPPNGRGFGEDGWTYGDEASCMESGGSIESYPVYPTSPY
jgi:hypothetical protein